MELEEVSRAFETRSTAWAQQAVGADFGEAAGEHVLEKECEEGLHGKGEKARLPGARMSVAEGNTVVLEASRLHPAGRGRERASGTSYEKYLEEEIFRPAGMTGTTLDAMPSGTAAQRYTHFSTLRSSYTPGPRVAFDPRDDLAPGPHGGAYSTAPDLVRFANALVSGRLLSASTLRQLTAARADYPWSSGFEIGGTRRGRDEAVLA